MNVQLCYLFLPRDWHLLWPVYGSFKFPCFLVAQVTLLCILSMDATHISKLDDLANTISIKREGILFHHVFWQAPLSCIITFLWYLVWVPDLWLLCAIASNTCNLSKSSFYSKCTSSFTVCGFFIPPSFELLKLYIFYVLGLSFRHIIFLARFCLCVAGWCTNTREHFHIYSGHGWSFIALPEVVHWKKFERS